MNGNVDVFQLQILIGATVSGVAVGIIVGRLIWRRHQDAIRQEREK